MRLILLSFLFLAACMAPENVSQIPLPDAVPVVEVPAEAKPSETPAEKAAPLSRFDKKLQVAKDYLKGKDLRKDYLILLDFAAHSSKARFHIVDLKTNKILSVRASHGVGSDRDSDGYAERFSNTPNSKMSSLGFYKTAETYYGKHGKSLKLDGLSPTNSKARERYIVIHTATYVWETGKKIGLSWGCPALTPEIGKKWIPLLAGGVLIYAFND